MELAVYNISGKKTSKKVKLNKNVFGIELKTYHIDLQNESKFVNCLQNHKFDNNYQNYYWLILQFLLA